MIATEIRHYSTEAFESSIAAIRPSIAVFDCDGTLWSGDAGSTFMRWSMETGLLSQDATDWLNQRYEAYRRGEVNELQICGEMVQVYRGLRESDLRAAATEFFTSHVEPNIFPELQRVIERLQQDGAAIWAVSSTCDWVIEEGVRRFGIDAGHVLAACVEVDGGIITDRLRDVPTDSGKVASLARRGVHTPDAVFGNSVHDAAMLAIARQAYPVNPTPALVERSRAEGWTIYFPASVRPTQP